MPASVWPASVITACAILLGVSLADAQPDYLLRRVADVDNVPPPALRYPGLHDRIGGAKEGLGALLERMVETDPIFRAAYTHFLEYLDETNTKLAQLGGGDFRIQTVQPGHFYLAQAVQLAGGEPTMAIRSNQLGVTWVTLMATAREFARAALEAGKLELTVAERAQLVDLLALGEIAAVANRVIPHAYAEAWLARHPDRALPSRQPPPGIPQLTWAMVRSRYVWMFHAGALPWPEDVPDNPHGAYDTYHFFSHAWRTCYTLYRQRYFRDVPFWHRFEFQPISPAMVRRQLAQTRLTSVGYELFSMSAGSGLLDITPTPFLPHGARELSEAIGTPGLPVFESLRDMGTDYRGARYGAALALSDFELVPTDHAAIAAALRQLPPATTKHESQDMDEPGTD